jgi:hypothetical protein
MDDFAEYYPEFYTVDDLQLYVSAGLIDQKVVDARIAAVKAATADQA